MKPTTLTYAVLGALFALALLCLVSMLGGGCTSPERQSAAQDLAETTTAATKDGTVTPEEADMIAAKMRAFTDAPAGADWPSLLFTGAGAVLAALTGIRILPNRYVVGPQEAQALDRAAGIAKPPA